MEKALARQKDQTRAFVYNAGESRFCPRCTGSYVSGAFEITIVKGLGGWEPGTVPYEFRIGPIAFPREFTRGLRLVRVNEDGLTAYYRPVKSRGPFSGAWVTVRLERRHQPAVKNAATQIPKRIRANGV